VATSRTTNPLVLGLLIATVCLVVALRRTDAPWAGAFGFYLGLAGVIAIWRTAFRILFAGGGPTVLFTLPRLSLPESLSGASLGGPVSVEALASGLYGGLQLGTMVVCVGAASALANPKRLLAAMPGALYELGTILVVAVSVFPQLAESVRRVSRARSLRSAPGGWHQVLRRVLLPVLVDALDRSIELAAAMDARGYGRRAGESAARRRTTAAILVTGVLALSVSAYCLLDAAGTPAAIAVPLLVAGLVVAAIGLRLAGQRVARTRYRPDRWTATEWATVGTGAVAAVGLMWAFGGDPALAFPTPAPGVWPVVTPAVVAAAGFAGLAGVVSPPPLLGAENGM
jgi:energy-coupling factor transport system permease protein